MIKSSQAGTTLRGALARLSKKPKEAEEELSLRDIRLSDKVTGDLRPIADIVADLGVALRDLPKEEKLASAGKIFGTDALSGWLAVLNQGEEELRGFTKALKDADKRAKDIAMIQGDTLQGSFKRLQSAIEGTKIGLGEKLTPSLRGFTDSITSQVPIIDKALNRGADLALNKINSIKSSFRDLTTGVRWGYAESLSEKIGLSWDKIIAEPFTDWWNGSGQRFISDVANKIGGGLGKFYKSGIDLMLGNGINGTDSLVGIGKSFADGFLKGFDIENTSKKIMGGIKDSFKGSYFNLGAYKEDKSLVNTAISGFMAYKSFSAAAPIGKGIYNSGKLIKDIVDLTRTSPAAEKSLMGTRLTGFEAGMSSGAIPVASILAATGGVVSAFNDFTTAYESANRKEKLDNFSQGITKSSMLGGGAVIGGLIGGPAGALIGAGLGGLGSLTFGEGLGSFFSDVADGTDQVKRMLKKLEKAEDQADKISLKNLDVDLALEKIWELERVIKDSNTTFEDKQKARSQEKEIMTDLGRENPDLIDQYSLDNNSLAENVKLINENANFQSEMSKFELQEKAFAALSSAPELEKSIEETQQEIASFKEKKAKMDEYMSKYNDALLQLSEYDFEKTKLELEGKTPAYEEWKINDENIARVFENLNPSLEAGGYSQISGNRTGDGIMQYDLGFAKEYLYKIKEDYSRTSGGLDNAEEELALLKGNYEEIYNLNKKAIERTHDLDGSIEDNVKNWDNLSLAEQQSVRGAIEDVENLIKKLDMMEGDYYINVLIADGKVKQYDNRKSLYQNPDIEEFNRTREDIRKERSVEDDHINFFTSKNNDIGLFATGGILREPHLGLIAEAGPEAVIPLSGANRERGRQLWEETGMMLGTIPQHAEGGIFGDAGYRKVPKVYNTPLNFDDLESSNNISNIKTPISINLGGINITIEGNTDFRDNKSIVKAIREEMPTIANDLCEQIATMLQKVFDNMTMEV